MEQRQDEDEEIQDIRKLQEQQRKIFEDEVKAIEKEIGKTILVRPSNRADTKRKDYDIKKYSKGFFDVKGHFRRVRTRMQPEKTYLINMELRNGNHALFVAYTSKGNFIYMRGQYIIDDDMKYFDISSGLYCLDYHQDLSLPIKRKIPYTDIRKVITATGITDVETAINPALLKSFQESNLVEGVMKGAELDSAIRQLRMISIIGAVASVGIVLYLIFKSGALESIL